MPGYKEAFVAKLSSIFSRNEGNIQWGIEELNIKVKIGWSVQISYWCDIAESTSSFMCLISTRLGCEFIFNWCEIIGCGQSTPACRNNLTVCVEEECQSKEYDIDISASCVCSDDICVTGTMGTTDQATAKIYILPKARDNLAPSLYEMLTSDTYNYC